VLAETVVQTTRRRTAGQAGIPWISDGWVAYAETISDTYCDAIPSGSDRWRILQRTPGVALTQAVKHRKGRRLVAVEIQATLGPVASQPYDVHVERFNGVLRDRLACLTRKTHAFAKQAATWDAAVGLAIFAQNWLRPHPALRRPRVVPAAQGRRYDRVTPATKLGLTDHVWDLAEYIARSVPHHSWG
jgi:hypothetical protein